MIKDFWIEARERVTEFVRDQFDRGHNPDDLIERIDNISYWYDLPPFVNDGLSYGKVDMTFSQWITAVEAVSGQEASLTFTESLENLIKRTALYQWEIREIEGQEEFTYVCGEVA